MAEEKTEQELEVIKQAIESKEQKVERIEQEVHTLALVASSF